MVPLAIDVIVATSTKVCRACHNHDKQPEPRVVTRVAGGAVEFARWAAGWGGRLTRLGGWHGWTVVGLLGVAERAEVRVRREEVSVGADRVQACPGQLSSTGRL